MKMVKFIEVIITILFVQVLGTNEYLIMSLHGQYDCSKDSLFTQWIFPLTPSRCTDKPFGDYVLYMYNDIDETVSINNFLDEDCLFSAEENNTSFFDTNYCNEFNTSTVFYEENRLIYVNFSVSDDLPFSATDTLEWFTMENYLDYNCTDICDFYMVIQTSSSSVFIKTTDSLQRDEIFFQNALHYCTENWFAWEYRYDEETSNFTSDVTECWRYLPQVKNDECIPDTYDVTLLKGNQISKAIFSCKFQCVSSFETLEIMYPLLARETSLTVFEFMYICFDSNCTQCFQVRLYTGDVCFDDIHMFKCWEEGYLEFLFPESDCQGIPYHIEILEGSVERPYYDFCGFYRSDPFDSSLNNYYKLIPTNDPYLDPDEYGQMAMIRTASTCDEDIEIFKKDLGESSVRAVTYLKDDFCSRVTGKEESVKGHCEKGQLALKEYTMTDSCYGVFIDLAMGDDESFCYQDPISLYYHHFICLPRYCGDFDEYNVEVCNGRGSCIQKDLCECGSGYYGDLCDDYDCFGTKYDLQDVCSGRGECLDIDICVCDESYKGEECQSKESIALEVSLGVSLGWVFLNLVLVAICCYICCVCCCCCLVICCTLLLTPLAGLSFLQRKKLSKFEELDHFEILMKEQKLEKDSSIAHLKIDKSLFEIPFDEVKIEKLIGEGGSDATVYLAVWKGMKVAFKCFKTRKVMNNQESFEEFEAEVNMLVNLNHPNVIRFYGASMKPPRVGIVMEYCSNGEVLDYILKYRIDNPNGFPISEKCRLLAEMINAIEFIHSRSIIHRDLKVENVLLDSAVSCKLMDFGISRIHEKTATGGLKTQRIGTAFYMAPEVIGGEYDEKVDTFSFGILMCVIFSEKENPYDGKGDACQIELRVASDPTFRPDMNNILYSFGEDCTDSGSVSEAFKLLKRTIQKCWAHDPKERYSFTELSEEFESIRQFVDSKFSSEGIKQQQQDRVTETENDEEPKWWKEEEDVKKVVAEEDNNEKKSVVEEEIEEDDESGVEDKLQSISKLREKVDSLTNSTGGTGTEKNGMGEKEISILNEMKVLIEKLKDCLTKTEEGKDGGKSSSKDKEKCSLLFDLFDQW